jgi:hypothetical protein
VNPWSQLFALLQRASRDPGALDVAPHQLIRIEVRRVTREEVQLQFALGAGDVVIDESHCVREETDVNPAVERVARPSAIESVKPAMPGFRDKLLASGIPFETGEDGLYGLGDDMGHQRLLQAPDAALAKDGNERSTECMAQQKPTRVVLTSAACYPVYPMIARRDPTPADGHTIDVLSYDFRHEPPLDPARMQMFRMREYVRVGNPTQVTAFRKMWVNRGLLLASLVQLSAELDLANDPFFGRGRKILANCQREQALKFELLIPHHRSRTENRLRVVQLSPRPHCGRWPTQKASSRIRAASDSGSSASHSR